MIAAVRSNFGLKVLSLALAILGWAYFRFAGNPLVTPAFSEQFTVPVTPVNLAGGYVARMSNDHAVLTIQQKPGEAPVRSEEVKAIVDLSNRGPGAYNIPIQLVAPSVAVQSLSPASVTLTIERIEHRAFPVAVHYAGTGSVVAGTFTVSPPLITVTGPAGTLEQIAAVRVDVPLTENPGRFNEMIRPVLLGASGNEIAGLQISPNLVRVQGQLSKAVR